MALDKEKLFARLQEQYLSRQEVLYKLPLNISIETFWPELLNQRKLNSTTLPLHNADGRPYWFVLTNKMIAASEILCDAALEIEEAIDPYRVTMTTAMTEEMYFTSFIEGAQIDVQEAMDFLQRGTEPENIQEQMIHNNRAAWSDMVKILYYPIDDRFVRTLAYRLTDGMDDQAEEYRMSDEHPIAAMEKEVYRVPAAARIPELMEELYGFLSNGAIHPLIKSAVAQAYVLVTRPFSEGNERLSRMVSYAVLLRSGYDFFRDISLSGVIARENYRYYKAMRDIIREENGGDLTYFIEYYLDLLARSLKIKAERQIRIDQEMLEREREAAKHPLAKPQPDPPPEPTDKAEEDGTEPAVINTDDGGLQEHGFTLTPEQFLDLSARIAHDAGNRAQQMRRERVEQVLQKLVEKQIWEFSILEWQQFAQCNNYDAANGDCKYMVSKGLAVLNNVVQRQPLCYCLPIIGATKPESEPTEMLTREEMEKQIQDYRQNGTKSERHMAIWLKDIWQAGKMTFTYAEWAARHQNASKYDNTGALRSAVRRGLLTYDGKRYSFCISDAVDGRGVIVNLPEKVRNFTLQLMEHFPNERFLISDVADKTGMKYNAVALQLDHLEKRGLVKCERRKGLASVFELSEETHAIFNREEGRAGTFRQAPHQEKRGEEVNEDAG